MAQALKDHLEHLRTVHFALVLVSSVLGIASFDTLGSSRAKAVSELQSIRNAVNRWDPTVLQARMRALLKKADSNVVVASSKVWIEVTEPAENLGKTKSRTHWAPIQYLPYQGHLLTFPGGESASIPDRPRPLELPPPEQPVVVPSPTTQLEFGSVREGTNGLSDIEVGAPSTVKEFQTMWDALAGARLITAVSAVTATVFVEKPIPADHPLSAKDNEPLSGVVWEAPPIGPPSLIDWSCGPPELVRSRFSKDAFALAAPCGTDLNAYWLTYELWLQLPDDKVWIDDVSAPFLAALIDKYSAPSAVGSFTSSFPDLARVPEALQRLDFSVLSTVLTDETRISTDRIEVLGAKIPVTQLVTYGVLVLVCIQAYLLLHVWGLRSALTTGTRDAVAWIGIYSNRAARAVTLISIAILPVAIVVRLSTLEFVWTIRKVLSVAAPVLVSTALALMSVAGLAAVWREWSHVPERNLVS